MDNNKRGFFDDSECFPKVVPETALDLQEYQPEIWSVKKDLIYKLIPALEAGLENTQEVLIQHDVSLGRDMTKNRLWAEELESQIRAQKECLDELKTLKTRNMP